VWGVASQAFAQGSPVTFSVIGDIPYGSADLFQGYIDDHNLMSPADFFVHVGDIMSAGSCPEPSYALVSDIMSQLAVPAFIIPGDNEWNDCDDPAAAWTLWESYFTEFEQRFCGTPPVEAQPVRQENFAFVDRGVLFVGLNLVGGAVHDRAEWDVRLQQDADWIDQQFTQMQSQVRAAVVFGHAARDGSRDIFFNQFDLSAAAFGKPIMFLHGNGHSWTYDTNWGLPNIWRIQVEKNDPPLEFTVTMDPLDPFVFERDPWPGGTPPYNRPPCVEVGPDQSIRLGEGVRVDGFTTDDGVPAPAGLSTTWSKASGPGQASFADPGALATDVTFSQPGVYVLRLTADDGGLASSGDVTVQVASGDPDFRIQDVSVTEGQSGTGIAAFTVQLLSATGAPASVDYATADGTATAGEDYQATSGTLSFSGSTISQTINVVVYGDEDLESSESFAVELSNAVGAGILDGTATGSILDDDIPPPPTVNAFDPPFALPGATVVVTGEFFTDALSVSVAGVPADFVIVSGTHLEVIVPDGIVTGPIRVTTPTGTGVSGESFDIAYTLSLELTGEGGVGLDPPGGLYAQGSTVTLTPLPPRVGRRHRWHRRSRRDRAGPEQARDRLVRRRGIGGPRRQQRPAGERPRRCRGAGLVGQHGPQQQRPRAGSHRRQRPAGRDALRRPRCSPTCDDPLRQPAVHGRRDERGCRGAAHPRPGGGLRRALRIHDRRHQRADEHSGVRGMESARLEVRRGGGRRRAQCGRVERRPGDRRSSGLAPRQRARPDRDRFGDPYRGVA
jgi:hypothetical protein